MTEKHQAIALIVALDGQNGIGRKGDLLCHLPDDLKHFKQITTGHVVIMGRKTYASLPKGALPNRTNIVITSQAREDFPGCKVARSVEEALSLCSGQEKVFIIGGGNSIAPPCTWSPDFTSPGFITSSTMQTPSFRRSMRPNGNSPEKSITFRTSGTLTALRSRPTPEKTGSEKN